MAIPAVNLSYYSQGTAVQQGTIPSQGGISGPQSKQLIGIATATLDGTLTAFTVNFIDGTQKLFNSVVSISASSATAPATIGGVANQSVISGVGAFGALKVGQSVTTAGFANAGNNGTFTVNAVTTSSIQVTNASAVAESGTFGANVQYNAGAKVLSVQGSRATQNVAGVTDTAASSIGVTQVDTITDSSCRVTVSGAGSNGNLLTVLLEIYPTA